MTATPAANPHPQPPRVDDAARHREVLRALTGLLLAMFVSMIANTVVSTSMPVIIHETGGDQVSYTWVVTGTLLATAISNPVWGKLADLYDRKRLFQLSIVIFTLATAAAGFAQTPEFLIACRVAQGLGGGGLLALSQILMADIVSPRERGRYMGLFGAVMAVATVGGPLAGGVITDLWGWRFNFFVAVPFAVAALVIIQRNLHVPDRERRRVRIDYAGMALLAVATSLLLVWVSTGGTQFPWTSWTSAWMVGGGLLAAVLFVVVERRVSEPLLPLTLFRDRTFTMAVVASVAVGVVMFGSSVYLAQYMQLARGATPTQAGLLTIPLIAGLLVSSTLVGRLITRHGVWKPYLVGGAAVLTAGLAVAGTLHHDTPFAFVALAMVFMGLGLGAVMQNLVLVVQNTADPREIGVATAGVTFFRTLGGTVGVSGMGAAVGNVVQTRLDEQAGRIRGVLESLGGEGARWAAELQSGALPAVAAMPEPLRLIFEEVYAGGIARAFLVAAPLGVVALVAVLALPDVPLGTQTAHERESAAAAAVPGRAHDDEADPRD